MRKQKCVAHLNKHPLHPKGKTAPRWTVQLKIAMAAAEAWHLKGCTLEVKELCVNVN
jgi:hypothetical protein